MRRTLLIAVALVFALSGCSFLGGGGTGLTAEQSPPGVSAENETLTNASALLDAHSDRLVASGFSTQLQTNATVTQRGSVRQVSRQQVVRVEPNRKQYAYVTINPGSRTDVWGNKSVQAAKVAYGDKLDYGSGPAASTESLTTERLLTRYLSSGEWTVTNVTEQEESTLVTLRTTDAPTDPAAVPRNASDVRDYEATAVVDSEGRVHKFEATGAYTVDGEDGTFHLTYDLRSLGDSDVTRPEWVSQALSQS